MHNLWPLWVLFLTYYIYGVQMQPSPARLSIWERGIFHWIFLHIRASKWYTKAPREDAMAYYMGTMQSPIGTITVLEDDLGIVSLQVGEGLTPDAPITGPLKTDVFTQLSGYFAGTVHTISVPVHLAPKTEFTALVYKTVSAIPYGQSLSYGEVALLCGRPGAARAVGNALRNCPVPIIIPCHRVIGANNRLGGYGERLSRKQYLLELEGIPYVPNPSR